MISPSISVCVCSYRRPEALRECLSSLLRQTVDEGFEVVVADDDVDQSALRCVTELTARFLDRDVPLTYVSEPAQNIAVARNAAVAHSRGNLIAFIDDDETADEMWLTNLSATLRAYKADAVIGAVIPRFATGIPLWMQRSGVFSKVNPPTGTRLGGGACRTSNVLAHRRIFETHPFDAGLGRIGGEDTWLFRQAELSGAIIRSSAEALVYETQERRRAALQWHLRRSYRVGWLYSHTRRREGGAIRALLAALGSSFLGSAKVIATSLAAAGDLRVAGLLLLRGLVSQSGKLGFFLFPPVEEYTER